ncbi:MAG: DUF2892 domain-containing protein [Dehalococcoidia bacterium]|nr:DUF2892 domain-containing protein [Dehalococcoidia bacterium]MDW8119676.1 DUF2892 domain-containing protein [Chloroflexota bacterium]
MTLHQARAVAQGIVLLASAAIALWVSTPVGLALVAVMGVVKLQEAFTDRCPSDLVLRPLGFKKAGEAKG